MKAEVLGSFSGGFVDRRAATAFEEGQWARLYGFVLEDSRTLRSQWSLQKVGGLSNIVAVTPYVGHTNARYLIAVTSTGAIKWCVAPNAQLAHDAAEMTPTWNDLENTSAPLVPTDAGETWHRRPVCTVPLRQASTTGFRSGVLFNAISLADAAASVVVYENDAGTALRFVEKTDHWHANETEEVIPKGRVGTMWNGVLVLGDIEWKHNAEAAFSASNKKRARNGLWFSGVGTPFQFNLDPFFIGDAHSHIADLLVLDAGLLVLTSNPHSGIGGIYLLRGTPADFTLETVREGVGAALHGASFWGHTGTAAWVSEYGEVWQTDGRNVLQLDWQGLGFDNRKDSGDGVQAFGPYLLAARDDRLVCLRAFDDSPEAAWTELALGDLEDLDLRFGGVLEDALYFLADGEVWRFPRPAPLSGVSERGSGTQGPLALEIGTRTLEGGDGHRKTAWRAVGVRATAGSDDPESAALTSVEMHAGPALDSTAPSITRAQALDLAPPAERLRGDAQFRGVGYSREFAATLTFAGDVELEQVTVFFDDGQPSGSTEGQ